MKSKLPLFITTVAFLGAQCAAFAQSDDIRTWRLSSEPRDTTLYYGSTNAEDVAIIFACRNRSGVVSVSINETNSSLRPNRRVTATLRAGSASANVPGKTVPNEEAGSPGFEGRLDLPKPLFAALTGARELTYSVGRVSDKVPLQAIGDKNARFVAACSKP